MGERGPAPTPTNILEMRGSWRADKNKNGPKLKPKKPRKPKNLGSMANEMWNELIPLLHKMKILTLQDKNVLERYCIMWARWKMAEEYIRINGSFIEKKDDDGNVYGMFEPMQVKQANDLADKLLRIEVQFGLTPSARSRVEVSIPKKDEAPGENKSKFFS